MSLDQHRAARVRIAVPPQHGAWAFLIVPLVLAAGLGAASWLGLLFALGWVAAYPVGYFAGGALATRIRRRRWTTRARRELGSAIPWAVVAGLAGIVLVWMRPWLLVAGLVVVAMYAVSIALTVAGRERGITNDLVLVVLATVAIPLMWMIVHDDPTPTNLPAGIRLGMLVSLVFFTGCVLHVKSLIREANDPRWHVASIVFHVVALIGMTAVSWWFLVAFAPALVRTIVIKPGMRPARIGLVETAMSVLVIASTLLAAATLGWGA